MRYHLVRSWAEISQGYRQITFRIRGLSCNVFADLHQDSSHADVHRIAAPDNPVLLKDFLDPVCEHGAMREDLSRVENVLSKGMPSVRHDRFTCEKLDDLLVTARVCEYL